MRPELQIRVLGPIDVMTPDGGVAVGGHQVRALLGALVIGAGHAVPIDHLRDVLWGDDPPDSADNTLQSYVSKLRHLLGADAVVMVDHSYELTAGVEAIDALCFESLVQQATDADDPDTRRRTSRDALHLWRGRPFGDLADEEAFRLETYRLDELRLTAMELNLEAELALGHPDLIIGELEGAVEEQPYREHLWLLLVKALAGAGRRVEAMRECARLRQVLAEVGVQPGDELIALEQQVLEGHAEPRTPQTPTEVAVMGGDTP